MSQDEAFSNIKTTFFDMVLHGEKTIESRWSMNKIAPFKKVNIENVCRPIRRNYYMAIKKDINSHEAIELFIKHSLFLKDYESSDKIILGEKHDYNLAKKVSSEISKAVKILLSTEEGLLAFIKLLDYDDIVVSASAAEYLYPLYPQKCLKILRKYSKSLKNKLDSYKIDTKIDGLIQKQSFFMNTFYKLYNCEDIDSLNRENDI